MDLLIRFAKMEDAEELLALYTPYVNGYSDYIRI